MWTSRGPIPAVRRYVKDAGHLYERLNRLTRADATTQNKRKAMIFSQAMDEMEERGLVGPFEGSKPRQLLITREQWQAIKDGAPTSSEPVEEEIP